MVTFENAKENFANLGTIEGNVVIISFNGMDRKSCTELINILRAMIDNKPKETKKKRK
jgi:hypothetical protein